MGESSPKTLALYHVSTIFREQLPPVNRPTNPNTVYVMFARTYVSRGDEKFILKYYYMYFPIPHFVVLNFYVTIVIGDRPL